MTEVLLSIVGAAFLGVIAWAVHLGDRVTKLEVEAEGLQDLINARFDAVDQRLDSIEDHLRDR